MPSEIGSSNRDTALHYWNGKIPPRCHWPHGRLGSGCGMSARHQCLCCHDYFEPDPRSRYHQKFCSKPACRKASKALSQQRWLGKRDNRNYWKGVEQVERVRAWRKRNPRYWKQSNYSSQLQDDSIPADPLVLGLVATLAGSTLQEDIVITCRHLVRKGCDILRSIRSKGGEAPDG